MRKKQADLFADNFFEFPKHEHNGTAYYLLYIGILGDKRANGGNVLTEKTFSILNSYDGPKVIYGEATRLGLPRLQRENITFKQIPVVLQILC